MGTTNCYLQTQQKAKQALLLTSPLTEIDCCFKALCENLAVTGL